MNGPSLFEFLEPEAVLGTTGRLRSVSDTPDLAKLPRPAARATDPSTSHAAAARAVLTLRMRVLYALVDHGPLTDFELADRIRSQQTSAGKRRGELVAAGLVMGTHDRRPAPSGSLAIVWAATPAGCALVERDRIAERQTG